MLSATDSLLACKVTPEGAERLMNEALDAKVASEKGWSWCKEKSRSRAQADTWVVQMGGILCSDRTYRTQINPDCSVTVEAK